ncbi:hypothetical protein XA68_18314 [Ophiocordyceps unilateralis]|uniref:Uncharacterized protein n=1 Tax=Ophiocordyceps unilateralis TaxID=268505 RepID=A0A2A9PJJ2_OPHUN|nr:hypothetical protein XA68_18314 [Ophiocordyceps unilateralis]
MALNEPPSRRIDCPRGQEFYACGGGESDFRGCCSVDPCRWSSCPDEVSSSRTDSGITHTVPNHSVVTVTRHTLVFSEAPTSTPAEVEATAPVTTEESSLASTLPATPTVAVAATPTETTAAAAAGGGGDGADISTGAIVGLVTGSVVVVALLLLLLFACRRRRRRRRRRLREATAFDDSLGDGEVKEEPQQPMSAHTTGTSSADPFAPFGGRADQTLHQPRDGTFEMDGSAIAPVELPAEPTTSVKPAPHYRCYRPRPLPDDPAKDPHANLNSKTDSGHAAYVNQWSHWRALGAGGAEAS